MDESDLEPDPRRRVPTILWLLLGVGVIVIFAAFLFLLLGHAPPRAVGPPPGQP
jgi:hypothetical protein